MVKFTSSGTLAVEVRGTMMISSWGDGQSMPIETRPAGYISEFPVYVLEEIADKVSYDPATHRLSFAAGMVNCAVIVRHLSQEILISPATDEFKKEFGHAVQSDPEVNAMVIKTMSEARRLLDYIDPDGAIDDLMRDIFGADWTQIGLEIITLVQRAYPQKWEEFMTKMSPSDMEMLNLILSSR